MKRLGMKKKSPKNQRRRPKQARSIAKMNAIIDASARVLAAHGYSKATTEQIALEADVGIGTLYEYFANKDEVFNAYINSHINAITDNVVAAMKTMPQGSFAEAIDRLVDVSLQHIAERRKPLATIFRELPGIWANVNVDYLGDGIQRTAELFKTQFAITISEATLMRTVNVLGVSVTALIVKALVLDSPPMAIDELKQDIRCLIVGYVGERSIDISLSYPG